MSAGPCSFLEDSLGLTFVFPAPGVCLHSLDRGAASLCLPLESHRPLTNHSWGRLSKLKKVKVKSLSRAQLFATSWTVSYQSPPSMGFSRQEYWSGLPFPSPEDLPNPGIEPRSPALQTDALLSEPPRKPNLCNSKGPYPWITPSHLRVWNHFCQVLSAV